MQWTLGVILLVVIAVMTVIWLGLQHLLLKPLHSVMGHIRAVADGDLTQPISAEGRNEMSQLTSSLHDMQSSLVRTVSAVRNSSDSIYTGASEISAGNNDLSSRTEQQAASLEETAASMEQLTATVKQNTDNARQASNLAKNASDTAARGGRVVSDVVRTMSEISSSSQQIAQITSVIDAIAFQTNILALNAAVEAARAGEQGRVCGGCRGSSHTGQPQCAGGKRDQNADRKLRQPRQLRHLAGGRSGNTMQEIVNAVTRVTDIMGEIASASDEQSKGIEQVSLAVSQMDSVTQQNASLVQESAAASAALEEQAEQLRQAVAVFRVNGHSTLLQSKPGKPTIAPRTAVASAAPAVGDGNWETF
jgi:methyl-accepting chemotaxis protein